MNVLVLGSGGREHALAWKIAQSLEVEKVFIAPGNAGTADIGENIPVDLFDHDAVIKIAEEKNIGLVVVGPDDALASGIVDAFQNVGIPIFGPTREAAEIEWSKVFAKKMMEEVGIPTARSEIFSDYEEACAYIKTQQAPYVIKADGLALGKGVTIARTEEEAKSALKDALVLSKFGESGARVVIEEFLEGIEISVHALCAGTDAILFPPSQDHKRIGEGDTGPNTGGMGTIAPVPNISSQTMEDIRIRIVLPLLRALEERGRTFNGLLFPGIMVTSEGPKVIEFNARFGDPETQSYMRLLRSDIVPALLASSWGNLEGVTLEWRGGAVACITLASGGYPGTYEKGKEIKGVEDANKDDCVVFHAGTTRDEAGVLRTSGGRVLGVTSIGDNLKEALRVAYEGVTCISFPGMQYRRDIGAKSLS